MMEDLRFEVVLQVIQYLNVKDSSRLAATSKRFYYLVHQYRQLRGPEIAMDACANHHPQQGRIPNARVPMETLKQTALDKLQTKPNLALHFSTGLSIDYGPFDIGNDTVVLEAWLEADIESESESELDDEEEEEEDEEEDETENSLPRYMSPSLYYRGDIQSNFSGNIKSSSENGIVLMSLPNTEIKPFYVAFEDDGTDLHPNIGEDLFNELMEDQQKPDWWKSFIIFADTSYWHADFRRFVLRLQERFPQATIVGGVADSCERYPAPDNFIGGNGIIVGAALGGENMPVQLRSIVSRGCRTLDGEIDKAASIQDLDGRLNELSTTVRAEEEEILGALMFSSRLRGMTARYSLFEQGEPMGDAKRFDEALKHETPEGVTKHVPCLGFYAPEDGEVGFTSTERQDAIVQSGETATQNPLVSFAVFVASHFDVWSMIPRVVIDDSPANIEAYFAQSRR